MVSYWMLEELIPARNEVTTVSIATPIPNLSDTVGLPNTGRSDSVRRLKWLTAVKKSLLDFAQLPATVSGSLAHIMSSSTLQIATSVK